MLMRINHHSGVIMTRYRSHTETQLAKINATLTKLLAAQLETNRLIQVYLAATGENSIGGASGQPGPTGPDSGPDNANACAGFTQITIDDLLGPNDDQNADNVWADLGYNRGNN